MDSIYQNAFGTAPTSAPYHSYNVSGLQTEIGSYGDPDTANQVPLTGAGSNQMGREIGNDTDGSDGEYRPGPSRKRRRHH